MIDSRYGTTDFIPVSTVIVHIDSEDKICSTNNTETHNYSCFYIHTLKASGLPEKPGKGIHLYVVQKLRHNSRRCV